MKDETYISDQGYVAQQDIVGTVFKAISGVSIVILVVLGILTFVAQ